MAVTTVGVIGLGDIGRGVADAVVRAGFPLVVCDVRAEATASYAGRAQVAASPAELGERSDVALVAVVSDDQVRSVLRGPQQHAAGGPAGPADGAGALVTMAAGSVVLVLSTISPRTVQEMATAAARRDVDVLDCGVSGGPQAAAEGSLTAMVGGDPAVVERVRPVLESFSSPVLHMGPLGAGIKAKLARNLVQYASWLAGYEAQVLAEAAGIELTKLAAAIRASDAKIGGASRLMFRDTAVPFPPGTDEGIVGLMANGAGLAHKDLRAAIALGEELGLSLPLARMTEERCDAVFGLAPDPAEPAR